MRTISFLLFTLFIVTFGCGSKKKLGNPSPTQHVIPVSNTDCKDTNSTIVFINIKDVELRVTISAKTVEKRGNTIINHWNTLKTITIPVKDSSTLVLKSGIQFMYTVYGPVSSNVNGHGVVKEDKFTLEPCSWRRENLY
ncbi:MAG: hypothetical protein KG003_10460 [Bacteroidetes bacterium]|nr:hypothetical protein [Bacteroidota bacterium]